MFNLTWARDAAERAIRTGAQVMVAGWPATQAFLDGNQWQFLGVTTAGAMGLSVLMSIIGTRRGDPDSASVLDTREP